ncbi:MAG: DegT/DnrJ/EryC1/StrS aminotransferase family protein [Halanaerobium sp.]|nr:DegT/DnrJ/EryC1/StrS aminotransferase family protein [Halanaerobium sp.]
MTIPIARPIISEEEIAKVREVMESGMLASGKQVKEFEAEFAAYCGSPHGIATSSGTTALHAALLALEIGPGDKVLTTPFTFAASGNSIIFVGAEPVFSDIDPETYNLDPDKAEEVLRQDPDIKAIMVVHLFGLACDMEAYQGLADKYDVYLIEDAAQSHGAKYQGQKVGTFGDAACFSFYPTKNMTTAEGGMILTPHDDVSEKARLLVNHGQTQRYEHSSLGYNFRLTNLAAAIGLVQLPKLNEWNRKRRENAAYFNGQFQGLAPVKTPVEPEGYEHVYHQYTLRVPDRGDLVRALTENGIGYGIHYPIPLHHQPYYRELGYGDLELPVAEDVARKVISLPVHPSLSDEELKKVVQVIVAHYS